MSKIYGYCRISTSKQNIERQERNILSSYPSAKIYKEIFTGTKKTGRVELGKLIRDAEAGDTIVFDSVSRMSRNADEGIELYMDLFNRGINLVFLKEPQINTATYKNAIAQRIETVGNAIADKYIEVTNEVIILLAKEQIRYAFEQSEKEVKDLSERTREGLITARRKGKQLGRKTDAVVVTKKEIETKEILKKHCKALGGSLSDIECLKLTNVSRNTYYKYKKELLEEYNNFGNENSDFVDQTFDDFEQII